MKTMNTGTKMIRIIMTAVCFTAAALSGTGISHSEEAGKCTFSEQLKDPGMRADYLNTVEVYQSASRAKFTNDIDGMYANVTPVNYTRDPGWSDVDMISFECVTCHDGMSAKSHEVRIKNNPFERSIGLDSVTGSHPIGMQYENYAAANRSFKSPGRLNRNMVLVDGKMGCITCHNPLNPAKNHMAADNSRSGLCFECHDK